MQNTKIEIELDTYQADYITIQTLKKAYSDLKVFGGDDKDTLGIEFVLEYFMVHEDYDEWVNQACFKGDKHAK